MSLPSTALLVAMCLLWATATAAQPRPPPLERKERQATLPRDASEPKPQVRVAVGVLTSLLFNTRIASTRVAHPQRFARLDVGERAIYLEPTLPPTPTEPLELHVLFADGREAVLLLVSHPTEVDTRVDFTQPERSATACERELAATRSRCEAQARCEEPGPALLVLSGDLELLPWDFADWTSTASTLRLASSKRFRMPHWWVLTGRLTNQGAVPWAPASARLTPSSSWAPRVVLSSGAAVAPGESATIAIELRVPTLGPPLSPGTRHVLTLCDTARKRCLSTTLAEPR